MTWAQRRLQGSALNQFALIVQPSQEVDLAGAVMGAEHWGPKACCLSRTRPAQPCGPPLRGRGDGVRGRSLLAHKGACRTLPSMFNGLGMADNGWEQGPSGRPSTLRFGDTALLSHVQCAAQPTHRALHEFLCSGSHMQQFPSRHQPIMFVGERHLYGSLPGYVSRCV